MSNGDEVLDNWEEIDEVGLTNTLQKIQQKQRDTLQKTGSTKQSSNLPPTSESAPAHSITVYPQATKSTSTVVPEQFTLSKTDFPTSPVAVSVPMKLLQRGANTSNTTGGIVSVATAGTSSTDADLKSPLEDLAASFQPAMMLLHKPADEYQSTTYAAPTNLQTVKILRRPTQSMEPRNNGIKPRQPIKTLQQREQEYAEARLRILGSAKNPEDESGAANTSNSTTGTTTALANVTASTNNTYKGNPKGNQAGGNNGGSGGSSGGGGGNGSPLNLYNNYYNHQQQQQQQQQANYYYMQQQKQHQQQQIPPAYNTRSMSALLPLPLPTTLQHQHQHSKIQPQTQHQTWSPVVGGSVSSSVLRQQQQESILRLPRGPDGSTGFQMRR